MIDEKTEMRGHLDQPGACVSYLQAIAKVWNEWRK